MKLATNPFARGSTISDDTQGNGSTTLNVDPKLAPGDGQAETEQIVMYAEGGDVASGGGASNPLKSYSNSASDSIDATLVSYLSRPQLVRTFKWNDSDTPNVLGTSKFRLNLPGAWAGIHNIREKLIGFRYFRCDFEVRVQVNAQPSQAGALLIAFVPLGNQCPQVPYSIYSWSGYPHAILDVAKSTSAVLRVPYIMLEAYFDNAPVDDRRPDLGPVYCFPLSALRGGKPSVEAIVWLRAVDIKLELPTGLSPRFPALPASGEVQCFGCDEDEKPEEVKTPQAPVETQPRAPSADPKRSSVRRCGDAQIDEGAVLTKGGTISGALRATGRVANALSGVPALAAAAQPAAWLLNATAGVAGAFGFSKPSDPGTPAAMRQVYGRNVANFNGDTQAKTLGTDEGNAVHMPHELFCSSEDDLAISRIVQKPIIVDHFKMTDTDDAGKMLWSARVTPAVTLRSQVYTPTAYCEYLAPMFKYWRGELRYTFQVIKTPFHSARIRVVFIPGARDVTDDTGPLDLDRCYSQVYDIRTRTDFTFCVPWAYHAPWCSTRSHYTIEGQDHQATGFLRVYVLTSLSFPDICAPEMEFLVWKSAGPDFQFAQPTWYYSEGDYIATVGDDGKRALTSLVECVPEARMNGSVKPRAGPAQIDEGPDAVEDCIDMLAVAGMSGFEPNQLTSGEAITSLRQLLKRNNYMSEYPYTGSENAELAVWTFQGRNSATPIDPNSYVMYGYFGAISLIYRFMSGSMIIGLHGLNTGAVVSSTIAYNGHGDAVTYPVTPLRSTIPSNGHAYSYMDVEKYVEIRIPHYYNRPARITDSGRPTPGASGTYQFRGPYLTLKPGKDLVYSRIAGEDFTFGFLLPPPTLFWMG